MKQELIDRLREVAKCAGATFFEEVAVAGEADKAEIARLKEQLKQALSALAYVKAAAQELIIGGSDCDYEDIIQRIAIQPNADALKAHDAEVIERCAKICEEQMKYAAGEFDVSGHDCADAIRQLKEVK